RDAATMAEHQGGGGARPRRHRGEAEQDYRVHVAVVRGVGLAVDLERAAGSALPHRHGGVPALAVPELTDAAVLEEVLPRNGTHRLAGVDARAQIDEPRAPARGGEGDGEPHAREAAGADHPQPETA